MNKILIAFVISIALVYAADFTFQPGTYNAEDGQETPLELGITDTSGSTLKNVSFQVTCSDLSVLISYAGSFSNYYYIGSIANTATGWGGFYVIGNDGFYTLYFNITYKKSGGSGDWHYYNYTAPLAIADDSTSGSPERLAKKKSQPAANEVVQERYGWDDLSLSPSYFVAEAGVAIWFAIDVSPNVALSDVSYTVVPSFSDVSIVYPPYGASLGSVAVGANAYGSFQLLGNFGFYELTVTVTYKKYGESFWSSYSTVVPLLIAEGSTGGSFEKREYLQKNRIDSVVNTSSSPLKAEYIIGFAAGIALVAAIVAIAAVFISRRRTQAVQIDA